MADQRLNSRVGPGGVLRQGGHRSLRSAMPSDIRRRNRQAVLRSLYPDKWYSRADLSRMTGLSKVSISDVVADLTQEGLVAEGGYKSSSRPGKPAVLVGIKAEGTNIMAVDLSEVGVIKGVLTNLTGKILVRQSTEIPRAGHLDPQAVVILCRRLSEQSRVPILGLGVATPGTVDRSGRVISAPNLGWTDLDLEDLLHRALRMVVRVSNDADSAVFGERCFANGPDDMILVAIARGVGAGVLIDDHVVEGSAYVAGEIGHVVVDEDGPDCVCGKRGCLEALIAVPVLEERIAREPERRDDLLTRAGEVLGRALAMPVALTNIADVTVSGPGNIVGSAFLDAVGSTVNDRVHSRFTDRVEVHPARLGEDAAVLGGVANVLRHELGVI